MDRFVQLIKDTKYVIGFIIFIIGSYVAVDSQYVSAEDFYKSKAYTAYRFAQNDLNILYARKFKLEQMKEKLGGHLPAWAAKDLMFVDKAIADREATIKRLNKQYGFDAR